MKNSLFYSANSSIVGNPSSNPSDIKPRSGTFLAMIKFFPTFCLSLAVLLIGCGGGSDSSTPSADESNLRIVHASPDAPSLDVFFGTDLRLAGLSFREASNPIAVEPGNISLSFNSAGTNTTLTQAVIQVGTTQSFTAALINFLNEIETVVIADDLIAPGENLIKFRLAHLSPSAPAFDVYINESGTESDLDFLRPVLENISFRSVSDFLQVERGEYRIRLTVAGTTVVAIDSDNLNLDGERIFTFLALESESGGEPFGLALIRDNPR